MQGAVLVSCHSISTNNSLRQKLSLDILTGGEKSGNVAPKPKFKEKNISKILFVNSWHMPMRIDSKKKIQKTLGVKLHYKS